MSVIATITGAALVGAGVIGLVTPIIPGTILILAGLFLLFGKRGMNRIKNKYIPWLKKKHAERKKRKLAKLKLKKK